MSPAASGPFASASPSALAADLPTASCAFDAHRVAQGLLNFQAAYAAMLASGRNKLEAAAHLRTSLRGELFAPGAVGGSPGPPGKAAQQPTLSVDLVPLISLAHQLQCADVHNELCAVLANLLDKSCLSVLRSVLLAAAPEGGGGGGLFASDEGPGEGGGCGRSALASLAEASAVAVLAHAKDLERCVQVHPPWKSLLRRPAAAGVFRARIGPVAPVFEALLALPERAGCCGCWADAAELYAAVLHLNAPVPALRQLLGLTLEQVACQTPKHLALLTLLMTVLRGLEEHEAAAPGLAAEAFFASVCTLRDALLSRLSSVARASAPSAAAAAQFFLLLAQAKELLTRAAELAEMLLADGAAAAAVRPRIAQMQDHLYINHCLSDRAAALLRALPPGVLASHPLVAAFLSGAYYRMVPVAERQRLGLPRPTTTASGVFVGPPALSVRCRTGGVTTLPPELLRPLQRLSAVTRLFSKWRAIAGGDAAVLQAPAGGTGGPPRVVEALGGLPLPVTTVALNSVLDYAHAVTVQPVVGGVGARAAMMEAWCGQMRAESPQRLRDVRACASVLGFSDCLQVLDAMADSSHPMRW